jgi:ribosomal protein S26
MPISKAPYKRTYKHGKTRGRETTVHCDFCGREVPRHKTFVIIRGLSIRDPLILKQVDRKMIHLMKRKMRACPSCARFRRISKPGKSVRKKHMRR